jgi:hypothetical protein
MIHKIEYILNLIMVACSVYLMAAGILTFM